jgi:hypothetical protein
LGTFGKLNEAPIQRYGIINLILVECIDCPRGFSKNVQDLEVYSELDGDHLQICKYESVTNGNYKQAFARLETIISDIKEERETELSKVFSD